MKIVSAGQPFASFGHCSTEGSEGLAIMCWPWRRRDEVNAAGLTMHHVVGGMAAGTLHAAQSHRISHMQCVHPFNTARRGSFDVACMVG
eukprot:356930-Chlamydomonas_euryale.AAC.9